VFGTTPYRTPREPPNDVSRLQTSCPFGSSRARASQPSYVIGQKAEVGLGNCNCDDAAPHRGSVPLGSGRFSAEQRSRAVEQQCQSTAQGRSAGVRSAITDSSAATPSAARRRRSTGCTLHFAFKKNESIRPSRPRAATAKHTGCDARARGADGAHLLRRLLGNGRHPEPLHDRDRAREPRALGARVHLLVDRDGVEDYLEFGEKKFVDGPDGLPGLGEHQHPGRGAEEARRDHERRAQERPALHGPHGRARLRGGGRARRGRRRHRGEVPEGGARREDAR